MWILVDKEGISYYDYTRTLWEVGVDFVDLHWKESKQSYKLEFETMTTPNTRLLFN